MLQELEIRNLKPGRKMDALVWQALHGQDLCIWTCRSVGGDYQPHAGYPIGHISPPHYSDNIPHIWGLIALLSANGIFEMSNGDGDNYNVRFIPYHSMLTTDTGKNPFSKAVQVSDEISFGSVICKTILLAVG